MVGAGSVQPKLSTSDLSFCVAIPAVQNGHIVAVAIAFRMRPTRRCAIWSGRAKTARRLWLPELFRLTFWSFASEFSSFWRQGALSKSDADPGHGSARLLVRPRGPLLSGDRFQTHGPRIPLAGRRSALGCYAAASINAHISQAADRLASTRARRAAAARAVNSAGTALPVPKYISSGVCPRNAEWGSTQLCSWT